MKIDIYKDGISYVTNEVSSVKTNEANLCEENRIKFVTDLAAVSRGKSESNNPPARYKKLLKEAAPSWEDAVTKMYASADGVGSDYTVTKTPSRPLEFLPVFIKQDDYVLNIGNSLHTSKFELFGGWVTIPYFDFINNLLAHSYTTQDGIYTNMRACINAGIPYDKIPYNTKEQLKDFVAIKANIPMFVWAQVPNTHTAISKEAQSDRVSENTKYWLPEDFFDRIVQDLPNIPTGNFPSDYDLNCLFQDAIKKIKDNSDVNQRDAILDILLECGQKETQSYFKHLGYPQEIYSRAMYYFKYKEVVMTGWNNNPKVWKHLFLERNAMPNIYENWTQNETRQFVECIKQVLEYV